MAENSVFIGFLSNNTIYLKGVNIRRYIGYNIREKER
jgi:hypothetical protein